MNVNQTSRRLPAKLLMIINLKVLLLYLMASSSNTLIRDP